MLFFTGKDKEYVISNSGLSFREVVKSLNSQSGLINFVDPVSKQNFVLSYSNKKKYVVKPDGKAVNYCMMYDVSDDLIVTKSGGNFVNSMLNRLGSLLREDVDLLGVTVESGEYGSLDDCLLPKIKQFFEEYNTARESLAGPFKNQVHIKKLIESEHFFNKIKDSLTDLSKIVKNN